MISKNKVLEKLQKGQPVIGCQIRSGAPMIAEIYGSCGFDYVFIEGEHFPYNIESVLNIVRACEFSGIEPFLRIPDHDPGKILQFLDMGVKGMFFPHCDTGEQVRVIMKAGKYSPVGNRGFSNTSRATGYGLFPMTEYKAFANEHTLMIPFIESKEAIDNLDDILASHPDVLHVGPGDLSESYGASINDPVVQDVMDLVVKKSAAVGVAVGVPAATAAEAAALIKRGFLMIDLSSDLMLLRAAGCNALQEITEKLK